MIGGMVIKKYIGYLIISISSITLSLELFLLKLVQILEFKTMGKSYSNILDYIFETPISISFIILILIFILGVFLIKNDK